MITLPAYSSIKEFLLVLKKHVIEGKIE